METDLGAGLNERAAALVGRSGEEGVVVAAPGKGGGCRLLMGRLG